ncbi:nuclear transport factor 2 family protein [Nocardia sp. alder85J]|uniref:nuclear transport factor 2 family protein n=1 Tax=Nocardia sp. alder85J TaxID=2862949 RepID=UPI001CD6E36E|nr:nuclear transport factor 2 family protein [Nocardia sp. alder85J]MCX4098604.1 nuclear transport factor 2 family protein [Nocardia sp. alder85J]
MSNSRRRYQRFIDAFTTAWLDPTGARLSALFADNAAIRHPGMAEPVLGRDAIERYFDTVVAARPDLRLRPIATATAHDTVFIHWQASAGETSWEGIDRFRLRGDHAEYGVAHFDSATVRSVRAAS